MGFMDRVDDLLNINGNNYSTLAKFLETKQSTVSNWRVRNSVPVADTAVKVAKFLNVTVEYLITGENREFNLSPEEKELIELLQPISVETLELAENYKLLDENEKKAVVQLAETLAQKYKKK